MKGQCQAAVKTVPAFNDAAAATAPLVVVLAARAPVK